VSQPEIVKDSLKPFILGVQGRSRSSMLVRIQMKLFAGVDIGASIGNDFQLVSSACYDKQQVLMVEELITVE